MISSIGRGLRITAFIVLCMFVGILTTVLLSVVGFAFVGLLALALLMGFVRGKVRRKRNCGAQPGWADDVN
jgi:UPF0716 family protein affecting phage T7 exclusion